MQIFQADISHLDELVPLFDAYRCFYRQPSDYHKAKIFLSKRLENKDSIIFIANIKNVAVGFTQLYPLFSSVSMQPMLLLNDLYLKPEFRNKGFVKELIDRAKQYCFANNQKGMAIQTEISNPAQNLYKRSGFIIDPDLHLFWKNERL